MSYKLDFLKSYFHSKKFKENKLTGDGGHRDYTRIQTEKSSFILMSCGNFDTSLKAFITLQNRLKIQVNVPQLFHFDLKRGFLLLEDLGDSTLESCYFQKTETQSLFFYKQALKQLIKLQTQVLVYETETLFDKAFFLTEVEQALKDMEKYLKQKNQKGGLSFSPTNQNNFYKTLKQEFEDIFKDLKESDFVFCHRDYHSRNLMIKNRQVYMIDFQDGARGPWFYDLASLLYDCYIPLKEKETLYSFYFENSPPAFKKKIKNPSHIKKQVELLFLQRGLKACGRFCAFKIENNKDTHLKYIPRTLSLMDKIASQYSYKSISKYTKEVCASL